MSTVTDVPQRGLLRPVVAGWRWFTAFRRTRPFWGGLWLGLGGLVVMQLNASALGIALSSGWSGTSGYILGGAMLVFALVAWFAPLYSQVMGLFGVATALAAFVATNLGGFLVGSLLGVIGGSMIWGWGEKRPRTSRAGR